MDKVITATFEDSYVTHPDNPFGIDLNLIFINPEANTQNFGEVVKIFRNNVFENISSYFGTIWTLSSPGVKLYVENNRFSNISSATANIDLLFGTNYFRNNVFENLSANLPVQFKVLF